MFGFGGGGEERVREIRDRGEIRGRRIPVIIMSVILSLFVTEEVHACKKMTRKTRIYPTVWQNMQRGTRGTMGRAFL